MVMLSLLAMVTAALAAAVSLNKKCLKSKGSLNVAAPLVRLMQAVSTLMHLASASGDALTLSLAIMVMLSLVVRRLRSSSILGGSYWRLRVVTDSCMTKTCLRNKKLGQRLMGETKWEKGVETASCDFLWFSAFACGFLQLVFCSSKPLTLQIKDQICKNLRKSSTSCRFSLFSLSHLALPKTNNLMVGESPFKLE